MKIPKTLLLIKNAVIGFSVGFTAFTIFNTIRNVQSNVPAPIALTNIFYILCYSAVWAVLICSLWDGIMLIYERVKDSDGSDDSGDKR